MKRPEVPAERPVSAWWQKLTSAANPNGSERQRLHAELLILLVVIALLLGVPLGLLPVFLGKYISLSGSATWIILAPLLPIGLLGYYLNRHGYVRLAAWLVNLAAFFSLYLGTLYEAPLTGTLTMYYLVVPLYLSSLFLSAASVLLMTLLCLLLCLSYPLLFPTISYVEILNGPARLLVLSGAFIALYSRFRDTLEQRRQRTVARREAQQRLLLETAFDGAILHESWIIREISEGGAAILGMDVASLIGHSFLTFLDEPSALSLTQAGARPVTLELRGYRAGEALINLEVVSRQLMLDGQAVALAAFRDITARKERQRHTEITQRFSANLRQAKNRRELPPVILDNLILLLPVESGAYFVTNDKGRLELEVMRGLAYPATLPMALEETILGEAMSRGEILSDTDTTNQLAPIAGDVARQLVVPLRHEEAPLGVIWLGRQEQFGQSDREVVQGLANIVAAALNRSGRHAATANYAQELERRVQERTQALVAANERLQELDRMKSKFVSDVSHELRTPVANLTLYLDLLEQGNPAKYDTYMARLNGQAGRLRELLDDILSLSRLELGTAKLAMGPVDLNELLAATVATHKAKAEAAGLDLIFTPELSLTAVWGERNNLVQVAENILINAIKYTDHGEIIVSSVFSATGAKLGMQISDTGRGIAGSELPHVTDRFYRGQSTEASNVPGTGLGLAIVAEIVKLHKGEIEIQSEVGEGTTITVWLQPALGEEAVVAGD